MCFIFQVLEFRRVSPPGPPIFYAPPTVDSWGAGPEIPDYYDAKHAEIRQSGLPNSGEGVFAKTDIKVEDIVCIFTGYLTRSPEEMEAYQNRYSFNESLSEEERLGSYKYSLAATIDKNEFHIPVDQDYPGAYHPSMGPKVSAQIGNM